MGYLDSKKKSKKKDAKKHVPMTPIEGHSKANPAAANQAAGAKNMLGRRKGDR